MWWSYLLFWKFFCSWFGLHLAPKKVVMWGFHKFAVMIRTWCQSSRQVGKRRLFHLVSAEGCSVWLVANVVIINRCFPFNSTQLTSILKEFYRWISQIYFLFRLSTGTFCQIFVNVAERADKCQNSDMLCRLLQGLHFC